MSSKTSAKSKSKTILKLQGDLTISKVGEIKILFSDFMEDSNKIQLDHTGMESVDFSYVQILFSFINKCKEIGKDISFKGIVPDELKNIIYRTGFSSQFNFLTKLNG